MSVEDVAVGALVVLPIAPLAAVWILSRHFKESSTSLRERAVLAIRDFIVASIAATLALSRLEFITLPTGTAVPMLIFAMLLVSLPSVWWLALYFRGSFR